MQHRSEDGNILLRRTNLIERGRLFKVSNSITIRENSDRLFKVLKFSLYYSRTLAACSRVSDFDVAGSSIALRRDDRSTCEILIDFLKALRFHQNQSILAVSQFESSRALLRILESSRVRHLEFFYPAYDLCKPLNPCKTASQSEHSSISASLYSCKINSAIRAKSRNDLRFRARRSIYSDKSDEMKKVKFREQRSMRAISRRFRRMNEDNIQKSNNRRIESTSSLFTRTWCTSHKA